MSTPLEIDVTARKTLGAKATVIQLASFTAVERRKHASAWDFIQQGLSLIADRMSDQCQSVWIAPETNNLPL
jgi:hypothetical protein